MKRIIRITDGRGSVLQSLGGTWMYMDAVDEYPLFTLDEVLDVLDNGMELPPGASAWRLRNMETHLSVYAEWNGITGWSLWVPGCLPQKNPSPETLRARLARFLEIEDGGLL